MKIAIEAQRIFRPNKHGMDFVALEAIRRIQQLDKENEYFILVSPGEDRCLEPSANMYIVELACPTYPLWEQVALPRALKKIRPDLLHCTSNTAPVYCDVPLVLTLHDIIFLEKRASQNKSVYQNMGWYYRRLVVPKILPKCKKIITVSRFERERIQTALNLDPERIVAIHNGFGKHFRRVEGYEAVTRKYLPEEHYLFFLGNTDPKKNTPRTLKAYALFADLQEPVIDTLLRENGIESIKSLLRFPGYIPNTDLPAIYSGASVFLYTSLRESFGIPLLEAMACGTPVVTSSTSAIPEVAGAGAVMVDPTDENAIAEQILKLQSDAAFREEQIRYGLERVQVFSWENTARELLKVYAEVLK